VKKYLLGKIKFAFYIRKKCKKKKTPHVHAYTLHFISFKIPVVAPGVVAHAFNPSTREAEAGGFLSSRPAWSTE
jgi:major histocompatibility complex class I